MPRSGFLKQSIWTCELKSRVIRSRNKVEQNDEKKPPAGPESSAEPTQEPPSQTEGELFLDQLLNEASELDAETVDQFLNLQDPEFAAKLENMSADKELTLAQLEIDDETAALHDEIEKWRTSKGIRRPLYLVMPFLPKLSLLLQRQKFRFVAWFRVMRIRVVNWLKYLVTDGRKGLQNKILNLLSSVKKSLKSFFADFKSLSLRLKLAFAGLLILFFGSIFLVWAGFQGKLLPKAESDLFLLDMEKLADKTIELKRDEIFENFYDNVRSTPNMLLIQKIVVNIRASKQSGSNPMFAAEFFVEGLNPDVVIEVKDREPYFRDLIQRTIEDFTFDQLESSEGKQLLVQALLREMNRNLTTGELRNIRFKTLIIKP